MKLPESFEKKIKVPTNLKQKPLWFVFKRDQLLVKIIDKKTVAIPCFKDPSEINMIPVRTQYLGSLGSRQCFVAEVDQEFILPPFLEFKTFRQQYERMDKEHFFLAGYAFQMMKWERISIFCSKCGSPMVPSKTEQAKTCSKCNLVNYPRLSPAVIVAVVKDNKILLGRSGHFPPGMYSVLAGFVEPGESLESCVHREIHEEVNIKVKNLCYFGSQFWPFSESLMIGFTAEYESGEILIDKNELEDAGWFFSHEIPTFPDDLSISRKLIDWFTSNQ